ncbi:hypothetical protein P4S72_07725 [Vibrio sp. PP-XX7]
MPGVGRVTTVCLTQADDASDISQLALCFNRVLSSTAHTPDA